MKIVILDAYTTNPGDLSWEPLKKFGSLTVYDRTAPEDVISRVGDAEIVYTNKTVLPENFFGLCPSIKFLGLLSTGYNVVDTDSADRHGVTVCNIPSYGTPSVAQLTIALLLEICLHVGDHSNDVKRGDWQNSVDFCFWNYPLIELAGKTMGIVGMGSIGMAVSKIASALGMNIVYCTGSGKPKDCPYTHMSRDEVFRTADVLSLHCPLTPDTVNLIRRETIDMMKDGCIIINTSRGAVINEQDLCDALADGKVYAAGVDVASQEPINGDNPLLKAKNCVITPHIAWATEKARSRLIDIAVNNLKCFLEGTPQNVVRVC